MGRLEFALWVALVLCVVVLGWLWLSAQPQAQAPPQVHIPDTM